MAENRRGRFSLFAKGVDAIGIEKEFMIKVSVAIVTLNEEAEIGPCLESVSWADEVIVVDAHSSDRTVEIAKKYTNNVILRDWRGYADQKNWAADQTRHDWILSLDADERITPSLQEEIKKVIASPPNCAGYYVPRKNFFLGRWIRHGGWSPDYTLRLFAKKTGRFGDRAVHEAVRVDGPTKYLENPIEHYTYRSLEAYHTRAGRYSALAAYEMKKEGKRFRLMDLCLRPLWTFLRMYLIRQGFRDGAEGLILAALYGHYTFLKYAKLWEIEKEV